MAEGEGECRTARQEGECQGEQWTGHCPAGIFKNIISNVTKKEEAGHGPVPCPLEANQGPVRVPRGAHLYIKGWLPSI